MNNEFLNKSKALIKPIFIKNTWISILALAIVFRIVLLFLLPAGQTPDEIFIFRRIWNEILNSINPLLNTDNFKFYPNNEYYYPPLYFLIGRYFIRTLLFFKDFPLSYEQAFPHLYLGLRLSRFCLSLRSLI